VFLYCVETVGIGSSCYVFILRSNHTDREHLLCVYFRFSELIEGKCVSNRVFALCTMLAQVLEL
jgi:hypothetical protein